jgi:hypothetical protein
MDVFNFSQRWALYMGGKRAGFCLAGLSFWMGKMSRSVRQDLLSTVEQLPTNTLLLRATRSAAWIELFQRSHDLPFFLQLKKMEDAIWVACKDDYYPHFGSKKRDAFNILPLLAGKSAAIHINARYWHTLAGFGTDTHYVENYLYLEHLGQFEQAELVENLAEDFHFQPQKEVDLRQMLY